MKITFALLVLLAAPIQATRKNPLSEVIALLDSLTAKIQKDGEAEAAAFKEFSEWCEETAANKKYEIKTAETKKEKLEAKIADASANIEAATAKIDELSKSIATGEADLKSATEIREKEAADFAANEAELVDVVDTLSRAISVIGREMNKNPAAFAQMDTSNLENMVKSLSAIVNAAAFSTADQKKLLALVQSRHGDASDDEDFGAPAAAAYKSHSSNIMDVLEDLKEKAEEELATARKAEINAKHNYAMLKQSLVDQATADKKDLDATKAAKGANKGAKATGEGDLAATEKDLADGKAALDTANRNCDQTAADHERTVAARAEELKTIAEAKQVLIDSTQGAVSQTYSLLQLGSQLHTRADLASVEVVALVRKLAKENHSAAFAQLGARIEAVLKYGANAGEDPFAKVKALISDLLAKLLSEADSEATEKAYCDEQIAKTEEKKAELEHEIAKLSSKIDQAAAQSASLKSEVKETQAELAALAKQQAEMDATRNDEHASYVQAKADLEQGLEGVRKALNVLRDYYGGAAMIQEDQPASPELHSKSTGSGQSIIGILEVVESDFAKNLAEEEAQESDAASTYEKMTQENAITKTLKEQDVKYMTQEFVGLDKSIAELSADRDTANSELSAVLEYYGKIRERCIAKPETYENRKARREAEIAGLKEALHILENEAAFIQHKKGRKHAFLSAGAM